MTSSMATTMSSGFTDDRTTRVNDYLDDKLQTVVDLENIDALLRNVQEQQEILRQQLVEAEDVLEKATNAADSHTANVRKQAQQFQTIQESIDRRLLILTQSETSDDAIKKFDIMMAKLRQLDIAKAYVDLLAQVEQLSSQVRESFSKLPQEALKPYVKLQDLAYALKAAQPAADDAASHLLDHVELTAATLWKQMKDAFSKDLEKTLKQIKWPSKDIVLNGQSKTAWESGVRRLLELQEPELKAHETAKGNSDVQPLVLLPLEVMARDLELRFKYHFEGDKPTNRTDKPEYFLSHVINLLNTYDGFFAEYLQPILSNHFRGSSLALNLAYIDSTHALITALLPMLRHKISKLLPAIAKQPQLLSHFVHELMSFDSNLRDDWGYTGGSNLNGWKGLTWEVLVEQAWFPNWLQVEKDFALSRYRAIIDPPESQELDYDSVDSHATKPTKAAIRVNDLLETITDRYRPLQSFTQKLRFLIDIQITIFDEYHELLAGALDAYVTLNSSIARTVQGVSKEEQAKVEGLAGLERLCRIYGSAEYLEKKMLDWSDDIFFLELWDQLQFRARDQGTGEKNIAGEMSISQVAEKTSNNLASADDSGALFDETASSYKRLRIKTEEILQENLSYEFRESLRRYGKITSWITTESTGTNLVISSELDTTIQLLTEYLAFLHKVLAEAPLRRIARAIALTIQTFLWDTVLSRHNFSTAGVAQFTRDVDALWSVIDRYAGKSQGRLGMRRLADALILIGMPIRGSRNDESAEDDQLGIWEVERRVFASNDSAREVLEELELENLTEADARLVLGRRVELAS